MKKSFLLVSLASIGFCAWAQNKLISDRNAVVRKANEPFHMIEVSSAIDLYISQGNEEAIAVSATDPDDIQHIVTEVVSGVLKIHYRNSGRIRWNWKGQKLKAYVSFKVLDRISASGASNVFIQGRLSGTALDIHLSGASDLKGTLQVEKLGLELSGASDAMIGGNSNTTRIEASGASDVKAFDLVSDSCTASASGASDIKITVNRELNVHASGASDIHYKGTAILRDLHSSGASSVSRKG